MTETRPAPDSGIRRVSPLFLWLPGHSAPNLIPRQGNYMLDSGNLGRQDPHSFPGYNLTKTKRFSLWISTREAPSGFLFGLLLQQMILSSFCIKSEPPKITYLDLASLATGLITFIMSQLGTQSSQFIKVFVADGSMSTIPLNLLYKLLHEKIILGKCARKNFASPQELVDFPLSDQESYVINLVFILAWLPRSSKPNVGIHQSN